MATMTKRKKKRKPEADPPPEATSEPTSAESGPTPEAAIPVEARPELAALAAESLQRIADAEQRLNRAEEKEKDAKVEAREAKAEKERLRKELHRIIKEETEADGNSLFSPRARSAPEPSANGVHVPAPDEDDSWKTVPLSSLALPGGIIKKLADAGIETMGHLVAYQEPSESGWVKKLTDLAGIGEWAVVKIDAATQQFWSERNRAIAERTVAEVADATAVPSEPAGEAVAPEDEVPAEASEVPEAIAERR